MSRVNHQKDVEEPGLVRPLVLVELGLGLFGHDACDEDVLLDLLKRLQDLHVFFHWTPGGLGQHIHDVVLRNDAGRGVSHVIALEHQNLVGMLLVPKRKFNWSMFIASKGFSAGLLHS